MHCSTSACPACGEAACRGHYATTDPYGWGILAAHNNGFHADCDPRGCDEWRHSDTARARHCYRDADSGRVLSLGVI